MERLIELWLKFSVTSGFADQDTVEGGSSRSLTNTPSRPEGCLRNLRDGMILLELLLSLVDEGGVDAPPFFCCLSFLTSCGLDMLKRL